MSHTNTKVAHSILQKINEMQLFMNFEHYQIEMVVFPEAHVFNKDPGSIKKLWDKGIQDAH